jgi:hypothetical protein
MFSILNNKAKEGNYSPVVSKILAFFLRLLGTHPHAIHFTDFADAPNGPVGLPVASTYSSPSLARITFGKV